jgi:regulator of protease activity HflC (stomatin/prohibitin superfamily)
MSSWGSDRANPWRWPVGTTNTIFNIVPQGHKFVVERFGKLHTIQDSGLFVAIPLVDSISYVVDMRERALDIPPQAAITRDNVSVEVSGNLFVRFFDAEKAAYGALNPLYSVTQHAQSAMRSAIGEMELDEILHGRARLNAMIRGSLQEAAEPWGLEIRRYEITEITPDQQVRITVVPSLVCAAYVLSCRWCASMCCHVARVLLLVLWCRVWYSYALRSPSKLRILS